MEASRYSHRSTRREKAHMPVQLQLVSDEDFVTQSSESSQLASGQISFSEYSGSISNSDLNISQSLQNSGRDLYMSPFCLCLIRKRC